MSLECPQEDWEGEDAVPTGRQNLSVRGGGHRGDPGKQDPLHDSLIATGWGVGRGDQLRHETSEVLLLNTCGGQMSIFPGGRGINWPSLRAGCLKAQAARALRGAGGAEGRWALLLGHSRFPATRAGSAENCWALRDGFRGYL